MIYSFSARIAPTLIGAALLCFAPLPGFFESAEAGSSGRSGTRVLTPEGADASEATESKKRSTAAAKSNADKKTTVVNKGKRSRRNPGAEQIEETMIAEAELPPTVDLAKDQAALDARIQAGDFSETVGALALYQLAGKAAIEAPLNDVEKAVLANLTVETSLDELIKDAETRLLESAADIAKGDRDAMFQAISAALGIERPVAGAGTGSGNLGASLTLETEVSPG